MLEQRQHPHASLKTRLWEEKEEGEVASSASRLKNLSNFQHHHGESGKDSLEIPLLDEKPTTALQFFHSSHLHRCKVSPMPCSVEVTIKPTTTAREQPFTWPDSKIFSS